MKTAMLIIGVVTFSLNALAPAVMGLTAAWVTYAVGRKLTGMLA